jgi:hypothetical protein
MLVEDRKYPRESIKPKYELRFEVAGEEHTVNIDLAVFGTGGEPLLALFFCPGEVGTFIRESVAAARVHTPEPFPLVGVTDSMEMQLVEARTGQTLAEGFHAVPLWKDLPALAGSHPCPPLPEGRLVMERRILFAYDGLGGPCCGGECTL